MALVHFALFDRLERADNVKYAFLEAAYARNPGQGDSAPTSAEDRASVEQQLREWHTSGDLARGISAQAPADGEQLDEWAASMRNYHEWGSREGALTVKALGNAMDAVPAFGSMLTIGRVPTLVYTAMAFAVIGHGAESVIYFVRTLNDEIL